MTPQTRGPYLSRTVPTGRAQTLVATAAVVNMRFNLPISENARNRDRDLVNIPYFLLITRLCCAGPDLWTVLPVHTLCKQDRLERSIAEDDTGGEKTVNDSRRDLNCWWVSLCLTWRTGRDLSIPNRLVFVTSNAPTGSFFAAGGTHVPTGLKLIFRCSERAGDEPLTCS